MRTKRTHQLVCEFCHEPFVWTSRSPKLARFCSYRCANNGKWGSALDRFWRKVNKNGPVVRAELGECWLWTGAWGPTTGYGFFVRDKRQTSAHRASYELNIGPIPDGLFVLHKCDNRLCVRPDHLFLGTHNDNMRDMATKGRAASHERASLSKLTMAIAEEIRRRYDPKTCNGTMLANEFNVTPGTVYHILWGKTWRAA